MARKRGSKAVDAQAGDAEFQGAPEMGVAVISGATFTNKSVTYYKVDGIAMIEGDIALGTVQDVEAKTAAARDAAAAEPEVARGVGISSITGSQFRWPNCRIPYEIDPALPNQQRVTDAIAHWQARTPFRFPLRTASDPNWVRFTDAGGCWSRVGMQGGQQTISLGAGCSTGNAIHEIGHTVGLWHEQSREDRDLFVRINWQNIQSGMAAQFNQHITDGDDLGGYDYGSIMHYPRTAFSSNGQETITPVDPTAQIGQRTGLSANDLAAVASMYPGCSVKKPWAEPVHFKKIMDDRPFKKLLDDQRFKKVRDDLIKPIRDPKSLRDISPVKRLSDPIVIGGPQTVINPGGLLPFSVATPHHAPSMEGSAGGVDDGTMAYLDALQRQLLDVDAAVAQAHATAAQSQADAARLQATSDELGAALNQAIADVSGSG